LFQYLSLAKKLKKARPEISLLRIVLIIGIVLMGVKFFTWWETKSNAILTDALESIINVVAGSFALFSLVLSQKPKDWNHPYGHGKIEFLSAGFEGALILLAGLSIIAKAIYNFQNPQIIHQLDLGLILTGITGGVNFGLGRLLEIRGIQKNSILLIANGRHLKSDAYSSLGLILGLGIVFLTRWYILDNVIALIFGAIILITGYRLVQKSVAGIMDEADQELIGSLIDFLEKKRHDNWIDIHNFRVIKYGTNLHIDCHMSLPWYFDNRQSHEEIKKFEALIQEKCTSPVELFIHIDPCTQEACKICPKADCDHRKFSFQKKIPWTLSNVVKDQKHKPD